MLGSLPVQEVQDKVWPRDPCFLMESPYPQNLRTWLLLVFPVQKGDHWTCVLAINILEALRHILKFLKYSNILLPPKSYVCVSSPTPCPFPLMKALFIRLCLQRPKFDKETLKGGQPHLFLTMIVFHPNSVTTPEIYNVCPGSLMLFVTWLLTSLFLSPDIRGTWKLCSELVFTCLWSSFQTP